MRYDPIALGIDEQTRAQHCLGDICTVDPVVAPNDFPIQIPQGCAIEHGSGFFASGTAQMLYLFLTIKKGWLRPKCHVLFAIP